MLDLYCLFDPFHPCTQLEHKSTSTPNQDIKSVNKLTSLSANETLCHMNPTKTDSSSMVDVGSLLNPMHPTLWLESTQSLPPYQPKKPFVNNTGGFGRVYENYHTIALRAFHSKSWGIKAEEIPSVSEETKGKVVVGGGSGFVGKEVCSLLRRKGYEVITVSRKKYDSNVITWDDINFHGLPERTIAVVNLAGQNLLDPLSRWNPAFQELVRESRIQTAKCFKKAIIDRQKAGYETPDVYVQITGVGIYLSLIHI